MAKKGPNILNGASGYLYSLILLENKFNDFLKESGKENENQRKIIASLKELLN
jgi:Cft2 family RNA processing exonuclease